MEVRCPQCQAMLALPDSSAGKRALCPRCSSEFRVPWVVDSSSIDDPLNVNRDRELLGGAEPALGPIRRGPSGSSQSLIRCPSCDRTLAVDPSMAGHPIICPTCKRRLRVPTAIELGGDRTSAIRYGTLDEGATGPSWQATTTAASPDFNPQGDPSRVNARTGNAAVGYNENPYTAPHAQTRSRERVVSPTNYALPGMFIMILTAFESLFLIFAFVGLILDAVGGGLKGDVFFALSFVLIGLLINTVVFGGGYQMTRRQGLGWAKLAAFAALLPCGLCAIFRIPIAIWAIVILSRDVAQDDFGSPHRV